MRPDRVSNPGPLTYESGALPIAIRGPAKIQEKTNCMPCSSLIVSEPLPEIPTMENCSFHNCKMFLE